MECTASHETTYPDIHFDNKSQDSMLISWREDESLRTTQNYGQWSRKTNRSLSSVLPSMICSRGFSGYQGFFKMLPVVMLFFSNVIKGRALVVVP